MAKLQRFEIKMKFIYKNTNETGILDTPVGGKRAVARQIEANRRWLAAKGHTETSLTVTEIGQCK